jgi:spore coat polysaccharide biosynthesis predicted glycosyltransferase SpsG
LKNQTILFAPLNWGLGHATRSLALAKRFSPDNKIILAGAIEANLVWKHNLKGFEFYQHKGFEMKYRKSLPLWASAGISLLKSMPSLINEKNVVESLVQKFGVTQIIADHRLGFYSENIPSYFIGHQLQVALPPALNSLNSLHKNIINKYTEVWVPDTENLNLSGKLSETNGIKIPVKKIGLLSQFETFNPDNNSVKTDLLILLSGPEPQRSIFENEIVKQLKSLPESLKIILVRGTEQATDYNPENLAKNTTIYNFISGEPLAAIIKGATYVLGRGGYSSLMDFFTLGGMKLMIVPTPGQTEQEYLAEKLAAENYAVVSRQKNFQLNKMLQEASKLKPVEKAD